MQNYTILGLVASRGAGKDTFASLLADAGYKRVAFADALYAEVSAAFGCSIEAMQARETKETPVPWLTLSHCSDQDFKRHCEGYLRNEGREADSYLSPREVLQQWGTFRRIKDPLYWLHQVGNVLAAVREAGGRAVVTDVRFLNEAELVKSMGGVLVRINRRSADEAAAADTHPSETELRGHPVSFVVSNNGTIEELAGEARRVASLAEAA